MNRPLTEVFSQRDDHMSSQNDCISGANITNSRIWQAEISHRFTLGVYELLGRIIAEFPAILFETCASGGGRFGKHI
jgi:hypothetical protein